MKKREEDLAAHLGDEPKREEPPRMPGTLPKAGAPKEGTVALGIEGFEKLASTTTESKVHPVRSRSPLPPSSAVPEGTVAHTLDKFKDVQDKLPIEFKGKDKEDLSATPKDTANAKDESGSGSGSGKDKDKSEDKGKEESGSGSGSGSEKGKKKSKDKGKEESGSEKGKKEGKEKSSATESCASLKVFLLLVSMGHMVLQV